MKILNLGCGTKVSLHPDVVNIDWSIMLRIKKNPLLRLFSPLFLKGDRAERYKVLSENIYVYDISRGIPFESNSVDVVYHSHLLEHLDRHLVENFFLEIKRVLKIGGVHRVVVPDFERLCKMYLDHLIISEKEDFQAEKHDKYISAIIEQSVRKNAYGTSLQKPFRQTVENLFLGDARRRGETHQWMYDRINLASLIKKTGYKNIHIVDFNNSMIKDWEIYGLDKNILNEEYKPGSLYLEAQK